MTEPEALVLPPTQDELPCDDGVPMETARHRQQMNLLIETIEYWLARRSDGYAGGNMFIYFSLAQVRNQDFRGPDFYLALDVPKTERKSWVVWEEGKAPDVVIELLSAGTARFDKTEKKRIYQTQMRVPEYFWYDPFDSEDLAGFKLTDGIYEPLQPDTKGRLVSPLLQLALVRWHGKFQNTEATWLRWATLDGELFPTGAEQAEQAQQHAEQAQQQVEQAQQQVEQAQQQAEQAQQQAEQAQQQAEQAQQHVAEAERKAAAEANRAAVAEEELAKLKALLDQQRKET